MQLFNTSSEKIELLEPADGKKIRMYHCGPTVYNYAHIGNLRAYVFADTLRRALEYVGLHVTQVINITDVGHLTNDSDSGLDKVEEEAKREHKKATEIADFYTQAFFADIKKLNINTFGTLFPKATDHISEQIELITTLEKKGFVYKTSDGLYFNTSLFKKYGDLGHIDLAHMEEGARIAKNPEKKNPTDFALWKFSHPEDKREQEWPSPWGVGFPGWHIECSAMSMKYLGETLDIHTGGIDHIPVHHNNEIAQSESATGKLFSRFWMHSAFVNVESGKMAKSEGNFLRLQTLEENGINPLAYRYWLLTAHYRTPVLFSLEAVRAAQNALESIVRKIADSSFKKKRGRIVSFFTPHTSLAKTKKELLKLIENDLDTPSCIALLHKTVDEIVSGSCDVKIIEEFDKVLGLRLKDMAVYIKDIPESIKKISIERETFRTAKNWNKADELRKNLENMGYFVDDSVDGSRIHRSLVSFDTKL